MCCSAVGKISWRYGETWQSIYGDHILEFVKEQLRASDRKWRLNRNGEITETNYGDCKWRLNRNGEITETNYGDHKWRLNCNGEITETNYGDKNFIHHGVESTYLERFKDRNV